MCVEEIMTKRDFLLLAVALVLAIPAVSQEYGHNSDNEPMNCEDNRTHFGGRPSAYGEQALNSFPASEAAKLTFKEDRNSGIRVVGWDRNEYSVVACKAATADSQADAQAILSQIQVQRTGGALSISGPENQRDRQWFVILLVKAPRTAALDLDVHNGPMSVSGMNGGGELHAQNGPISLKDSSGNFTVETQNGPISYSGRGGNVKLNAQNGPIQVDVAGEQWSGELSGQAVNGPIELLLPTKFSSGVQVENDNAPMSCDADLCHENVRMDGHRLTLGGSNTVIRLSTHHGPVTVQNRKKL
jgi:hypothetical protein